MKWRKRIEERITLLRGDVNDLSFCKVCWAAVWLPHKHLHEKWHETLSGGFICDWCNEEFAEGDVSKFVDGYQVCWGCYVEGHVRDQV